MPSFPLDISNIKAITTDLETVDMTDITASTSAITGSGYN